MTIIILVTAWAVIEAAIAIAIVARPGRDADVPGLTDWRC